MMIDSIFGESLRPECMQASAGFGDERGGGSLAASTESGCFVKDQKALDQHKARAFLGAVQGVRGGLGQAALEVWKFGGTSVADPEKILAVAHKIARAHQQGLNLVVVVSAMAGMTNQLADWVHAVTPANEACEDSDLVLAAGEQITTGLLSLALRRLGLKVTSFLGWQLPLLTDANPGQARIASPRVQALHEVVHQGGIAVVAGFQGVTSQGRVTTLGRGGSDTTAVVLASALKASRCVIYTDVPGVFRANPSQIPHAHPYTALSYEDMAALSHHGAKVLHVQAAMWADQHRVPLTIASTFQNDGGTIITPDAPAGWGLTCRDMDRWIVPHLTPEQADLIQTVCTQRGVPILEWQRMPQGLAITCFHQDSPTLEPLLHTAGSQGERVSQALITVVGGHRDDPMPVRTTVMYAMEAWRNQVPMRTMALDRALGLLVPRDQAASILDGLYQALWRMETAWASTATIAPGQEASDHEIPFSSGQDCAVLSPVALTADADLDLVSDRVIPFPGDKGGGDALDDAVLQDPHAPHQVPARMEGVQAQGCISLDHSLYAVDVPGSCIADRHEGPAHSGIMHA